MAEGRGASTRRQEIVALLEAVPRSFEELRALLGCSVAALDEDLRHVERSARGAGRRLRVEPACCRECGFVFRNREPRRFHPPSRCPRCRSEWIEPARLALPPGAPTGHRRRA